MDVIFNGRVADMAKPTGVRGMNIEEVKEKELARRFKAARDARLV